MKLLETILKSTFELHVDDNLNFDDKKKDLINKFLYFCINELGIKNKFECYIVYDRESNDIATTAKFLPNSNEIYVYGKNRMLGDILRSVAHELTHAKQHQNNELTDIKNDGSDGSPIENEANAKAGEIIRKFGKKHKNIFENRVLN